MSAEEVRQELRRNLITALLACVSSAIGLQLVMPERPWATLAITASLGLIGVCTTFFVRSAEADREPVPK